MFLSQNPLSVGSLPPTRYLTNGHVHDFRHSSYCRYIAPAKGGGLLWKCPKPFFVLLNPPLQWVGQCFNRTAIMLTP